MKKLFAVLLVATMLISMVAFSSSAADIKVVYVADGGTGDGSAKDKPVGTFEAAVNLLSATGGTIALVGDVTIASTGQVNASDGHDVRVDPKHEPIYVTSADAANKKALLLPTNANLQWVMNGEYYFDNLYLTQGAESEGGTYTFFICNGYHTTFGKGLEVRHDNPDCTQFPGSTRLALMGMTRKGLEEFAREDWRTAPAWLTLYTGEFQSICYRNSKYTSADYPDGDTGATYAEILGDIVTSDIQVNNGSMATHGATFLTFKGLIKLNGNNFFGTSGAGGCTNVVTVLSDGGNYVKYADGSQDTIKGAAKVGECTLYYNDKDAASLAFFEQFDTFAMCVDVLTMDKLDMSIMTPDAAAIDAAAYYAAISAAPTTPAVTDAPVAADTTVAPSADTTAPVTQTPATDAPATADFGIVAIVLSAASLAAIAVIVTKKVKED